jgi:SAM-dependent methyltransferase
MARVEGETRELDYSSTFRLFEKLASNSTPSSSHAATVFADLDDAEHRHAAEIAEAMPIIAVGRSSRVVDIGCGGGRWATTLVREIDPPVANYTGVDFSPTLIGLARQLPLGGTASFHVMSADALDLNVLGHGYTHALVTALCLYLNDSSVDAMIGSVSKLVRPDGRFYLREPVSLTGTRLTLIDEFSERIGDSYNAIYRTLEDYEAMMTRHGFDIERSGFLSAPAFHRHATTRHRYFLGIRR